MTSTASERDVRDEKDQVGKKGQGREQDEHYSAQTEKSHPMSARLYYRDKNRYFTTRKIVGGVELHGPSTPVHTPELTRESLRELDEYIAKEGLDERIKALKVKIESGKPVAWFVPYFEFDSAAGLPPANALAIEMPCGCQAVFDLSTAVDMLLDGLDTYKLTHSKGDPVKKLLEILLGGDDKQ